MTHSTSPFPLASGPAPPRPRSLPLSLRFSSRDFVPEELGECMLDVVLKPGDLLYMPRGTVHQAASLPGSHSLHLTLSAFQQRTWAGEAGGAGAGGRAGGRGGAEGPAVVQSHPPLVHAPGALSVGRPR